VAVTRQPAVTRAHARTRRARAAHAPRAVVNLEKPRRSARRSPHSGARRTGGLCGHRPSALPYPPHLRRHRALSAHLRHTKMTEDGRRLNTAIRIAHRGYARGHKVEGQCILSTHFLQDKDFPQKNFTTFRTFHVFTNLYRDSRECSRKAIKL
jgi:hypothetical protein